jgi:predicted helicase
MCSQEQVDRLYETVKEQTKTVQTLVTQQKVIHEDLYGSNGKKGALQKISEHDKFIWMFGGVFTTVTFIMALAGLYFSFLRS